MLSKITSLTHLIKFLLRYPTVKIVGGPKFLRLLYSRQIESPPGFYSQAGQDSFVCANFFASITLDCFPKLFLDIGCNRPLMHSNSYFFEKYLGFRVLAIDALDAHQNEWSRLRPDSEFICAAVGERAGMIDFEVSEGEDNSADMFSSVAGASQKFQHLARKKTKVELRTIDSILSERQIDQVGIISIDIEGYELNALRGIDFSKTKVMVFIVENNSSGIMGSNSIRELLSTQGYVFYARTWCMDDIFVHPSMLNKEQH